MYAPKPFQIESQDIRTFISENSLATITSSTSTYPIASHIPLIWHGEKLLGHFSRANPHVKHLQTHSQVLLVFSGANGYISSFAKDPENLSILPTWDYQIVHGTGNLHFVDNDALVKLMHKTMKNYETNQPKALHLNDYPQDVLQKKLRGIIGFEINMVEWTSCFRLNQNRTEQERAHIKQHLKANTDLVNAINKYNVDDPNNK